MSTSSSLFAINLGATSLAHANLTNANLTRTDARGADFRRANLTNAKLVHAQLEGANLSNAIMQGANLSGAIVNNSTDLTGTDLKFAAVDDVDLSKAPLTQAQVDQMFGDLSVTLPAGIRRPSHWSAVDLVGDDFIRKWREWQTKQGYKLKD